MPLLTPAAVRTGAAALAPPPTCRRCRPARRCPAPPRAAASSDQPAADWRAFRASLVAQEAAEAASRIGQAAGTSSSPAPSPSAAGRVVPPPPPASLLGGTAARWAHALAAPERGCLLVARRPDLGPLFTHSVVLVVDHDPRVGSAGLVLNTASRGVIADVGLDESVAGAFGPCTLYCGGPVARNSLHVLHGARGLPGAHEVLDGVYAGGLPHANALVRAGDADASDFRLLAGYAGWEPGQLEAEVGDGSWWVVAASPGVVLEAVQGRLRGPPPPSSGAGARGEKAATWAAVLGLAGIPLPPLAGGGGGPAPGAW